jgi:serine/threonine protein kinase
MAIETADEFLAVLQRSRLLSPEQLSDARLAAQQDSDPKALAKVLVQREAVTRWQAGQLLAGRSSFFLGKYKLIEPLGRGGMGGVFLGQHTTMNRPVALKILSRQVGKDPSSLERFLDEARAIAALDHPNIVQAYSVDQDADRYYLVMEYIDGRDLKRLVEAEGLPDYQSAADYIRQAADGLAHGHARKMIHCDIKPSNLLVNGQGVLKIVDMGLTRLNGRIREDVNGQGERVLGSVDYLAPEQALERADFDHRADIYSLGCTLYFLLTGHPPFPEGTLSERIVKHQLEQPRSIYRERQDAPAGLVRICEKMMAKRPEDRFQSAEEVSRALAQWKLGEPKRKRGVPLKTAEPLEELAGERLPAINVDPERQPTRASRAGQERPLSRARGFPTRRQAVVAVLVAGLAAVAMAAAAVWWLTGSGWFSSSRDRTQGWSHPSGAQENGSARKRSTSAGLPAVRDEDGSRERLASNQAPNGQRLASEPPPGGGPTEEPSGEEPSAKKPPADRPEAEAGPANRTEPGAKQPQQPPAEPGKKPDGAKKDPFGQLAWAVDLPVPRANVSPAGTAPQEGSPPGVPVSLGMLQLEPSAVCLVELKGGKDLLPGNRQLALDRDPRGKTWLIRLDSEGKQGSDSQGTDLARLWLEEQTLKFQWLGGVDRTGANCLRACGLLVGVDEQTRWLPLGRPKMVEPLLLDLDSGVARTSLPTADWTPKIGKLRLQITGLEGPFPTHVLKPADGVSQQGYVDVLLSGNKLPGVGLRVGLVSRGRAAGVEVKAVYRLANQVQRPLKSQEALRLAGEFYAMQTRWQTTLDKLPGDDPRRPDVQRQIDLLKEALEQLKALGDLYRQLHHRGKIHFRVFRAVEDRQIDLFVTKTTTPEDRPGGEQPQKP